MSSIVPTLLVQYIVVSQTDAPLLTNTTTTHL